ncbi:MAG: glycosyltransferase family 9 protein [Bdellovibrionaceae bacterium]|nr:glycosyltransferase family 9 protein [Pseudobdellovibrionaceae bacterium]
MKILIIQLARLGDIYMSWPVARALKRKHPEAELHFLVRERFSVALEGLESVQKIHKLNSAEIFEKMFDTTDAGIKYLGNFLDGLQHENYDLVVNLTFSPVSSYFTYYIGQTAKATVGYSRFQDSSFALKEAISAYYFAQVGPSKHNRFHLIDIFASLCDIDLQSEDFAYPVGFSFNSPIKDSYITIQLGASQSEKTLTPFIWARVIKNFLAHHMGFKVVLIGSKDELDLAPEIYAFNSHTDIINLIGKTSVPELFPILKNSALHIGGDSLCVHITNLTKTPCLNLSFESVKFWETGPRSRGSYVLLNIQPSHVESTEVSNAIKGLLFKKPLPQLIEAVSTMPSYDLKFNLINDFEWGLVKAIYLNEQFPVTDDMVFFKGVEKLNQTNNLIIETLESALVNGVSKFVKILASCDEAIMGIRGISPKVSVYIDWCLAEKIKVPPLTENEIVESYLKVHNELKLLIRPYLLEDNTQDEVGDHG